MLWAFILSSSVIASCSQYVMSSYEEQLQPAPLSAKAIVAQCVSSCVLLAGDWMGNSQDLYSQAFATHTFDAHLQQNAVTREGSHSGVAMRELVLIPRRFGVCY